MGGYDTQEFAGGDDLGVLPELGEMALITRHEVVCTCGIRKFNEHVVCRVRSDLNQTRGFHDASIVLDARAEVLPQLLMVGFSMGLPLLM
jgi:hypothetical protein